MFHVSSHLAAEGASGEVKKSTNLIDDDGEQLTSSRETKTSGSIVAASSHGFGLRLLQLNRSPGGDCKKT